MHMNKYMSGILPKIGIPKLPIILPSLPGLHIGQHGPHGPWAQKVVINLRISQKIEHTPATDTCTHGHAPLRWYTTGTCAQMPHPGGRAQDTTSPCLLEQSSTHSTNSCQACDIRAKCIIGVFNGVCCSRHSHSKHRECETQVLHCDCNQ